MRFEADSVKQVEEERDWKLSIVALVDCAEGPVLRDQSPQMQLSPQSRAAPDV